MKKIVVEANGIERSLGEVIVNLKVSKERKSEMHSSSFGNTERRKGNAVWEV